MSERRRRARYKPGQIVAESGIYKVYHNRHRLMHMATLVQHAYFPRCKVCKNAVRFVLERPVQSGNVLPFRSTDLLVEWKPSGRAS